LETSLTLFGAFGRIIRLYAGWAPYLAALALIVFVPVGLVHSLTLEAELGEFELGGIVELAGLVLAIAALAVTGLLGEVFYTGAVAALITGEHDAGERPTLRQIAGEVEYGRLIAIDLIYGLTVAIGFLLLVVPGVAAFVFFALAAPVAEIEGGGIRAAFARSARLVRRRFWTVLAMLVPIELVNSGLTRLLTDLSEDALGEGLLAHWAGDVASNVALTPFYAVAAVLITVALIHEKDGAGPRIHSSPST
jgi:hypothetical protein